MDELKLIERLLDVLNDWDLSCSEEPELKLEIARQQAKVVKLLAATDVVGRSKQLICSHGGKYKRMQGDEILLNFEPKKCMPDNINSKEEHEEYLKAIGREKYVKDLEHFKDSSVGLYATDKPIGDLLHLFWQHKGKTYSLENSLAEKEANEFSEWVKSISWQL